MRSLLRANWSADAVRKRLLYACDCFFGGNLLAFAHVLKIRPASFRAKLRNKKQIPIDLIIRIVQRTDIRLEWLLFGTEPAIRAIDEMVDSSDVKSFALARDVKSTYPVFTEFVPVVPPSPPPMRYPAGTAPSAAAVQAAEAIYSAQAAGKPVLLFADVLAARSCRKLIMRLLQQNSLAGLVYTGRALEEELTADSMTFNVSVILLCGAQAGIGFGEAAQRWGGITKRSPVRAAQRRGVPFAAHVSMGEMFASFSGFSGAADAGAALGACSYVDALVLADNIRQLLEFGGVFLALASPARVLDWLPVVCKCVGVSDPAPFSVIFFGTQSTDAACDLLYSVGGTAHFLEGDLPHVAEAVRSACVTIFDGKTNDDEDNITDS